MREKINLNIVQFMLALAVPFIVGAAGATVTLMSAQAGTNQRLDSLEQRASKIEVKQDKSSDETAAIRESLARIEGALGVSKK